MMAAASRDGDLQLAIGASFIFEICWATMGTLKLGNWNELAVLRMVPTDGWLQSSTGCYALSCLFFSDYRRSGHRS